MTLLPRHTTLQFTKQTFIFLLEGHTVPGKQSAKGCHPQSTQKATISRAQAWLLEQKQDLLSRWGLG